MKRIIYTLIFFASLTITSCEGFLDKAPLLTQSTEITTSSYAGLDKAVSGTYAVFNSSSWYGGEFIITPEMRSGNGWRQRDGAYQSNRYTNEYNWIYSDDFTPSTFWEYTYLVISAANNVLVSLDGIKELDVTEQNLNDLKAECLFMRALSYFDLVLYYGQPYTYSPESLGVPIVLVPDLLAKPARNTVKEVYDRVLADLIEAETIIDEDYTRAGFVGKSSVSKFAIQALLSRVYLYMGDWQKSAEYSTKVIDSEKFNMWKASEYEDVWTVEGAANGGEVIFEIYGSKTNNYYGGYVDISYLTDPEGYADAAVSKDILGMYDPADIRGKMFRTDDDKTSGITWTTKYEGKGAGVPDCNNIIVLRLSEMYLNRAEALSNGATITGAAAQADLNTIRSNRGLTILSATLLNIQNERRMEFVYEGHYLFDLARWGQGVERYDFDGTNADNKDIPFPDNRWAIPIAKREMEVNENLVQNPGF